ncbi:helix-turn-helix transcriptional regulator [Halovivax gelatinilyticus]|uniref:helix-turn-helix transcriptional regulator n=1 Tax=Halovivax gelatinilyticus TaxID=2961597 RepID=UPI0020CA91F0|nr:transcriptional regulator [Halovivax gelatinilyticus]
MNSPTDDIEFLVSSAHRIGVLEALADGPRDRTDLRAETGASAPTMGRILADFQDRHWIERDGTTYRITDLGAYVADQFGQFQRAMAYQRRLREVWPWLPHDIDGFSVELFTDVVVSHPGPGYPFTPIERLTECLEATRTMSGFGMALLKSGNLTEFFDQIRTGLECEYIYPPTVLDDLLSWDEETVVETVTQPNYTVFVHDDLPLDDRCGICLFDDRVSLCCYDPNTGALQALVDTESDDLRAWARSHYEQLRNEARTIDDETDLQSVEPFH